jgi:hypothetical protein
MRTLRFELSLVSEVVQTAAASSLGTHHTLDYIRGGSLLGAVASRVYAAAGELAFDLFHSGRVRFHDAQLLTSDGVVCWPAPKAWLYPKGRVVAPGGRIDSSVITIGCFIDPGEAARGALQPMRGGWITDDGRLLTVDRRYRLKTAVERGTRGRVVKGSLFGYESLAAGSRWVASVDIDAEVDPRVDDLIGGVLGAERIWLGRSRGAEYGETRCEPSAVEIRPSGPDEPSTLIAVYAWSDLALVDPDTGEPTTHLRPTHVGLPSSMRLDPLRSQVMTRRFSPFNGARAHRTVERMVIERGSVLTFVGETPADRAAARSACEAGVGLYRQEGLGRVAIDPWFLASKRPTFRARSSIPSESTDVGAEPPGGLAQWMVARAEERRASEDAEARAHDLAELWRGEARRDGRAPTRSQWYRLAELARGHVDQPHRQLRQAIESDVFAMGSSRGVRSKQWGERLRKKIIAAVDEALPHTARIVSEAAKLAATKSSPHRRGAQR